MRIIDWSSDVCSSDLGTAPTSGTERGRACRSCGPHFALFCPARRCGHLGVEVEQLFQPFGVVLEAPPDIDAFQHLVVALVGFAKIGGHLFRGVEVGRSEEHTSELQSLMRISYA